SPYSASDGGEADLAPRLRGRLEAFRMEMAAILNAELENVEKDFDGEILALENRLALVREENMRRAAEVARMRLEHTSDKQRRDKDFHRLEQAMAAMRMDLEHSLAENRELNERYIKLQSAFQEKTASLERVERQFQEELHNREREIKDLTAANARFERKINALMEVQRRLEDALGQG
ncbi:MAG TPA: hypothetical protein VNZ52_13210, partial [Candidatus Thermoplasmatota archaeon]|nr:hypothetical protein [Candidatus Thermoplasmatota archaeon]